MKRTILAVAIAGLALCACGNRAALEPAAGDSLPVAPAGAEDTPTPDELVEPGPQAKPGRSDEPLTRSDEREDDPFDLPPPE